MQAHSIFKPHLRCLLEIQKCHKFDSTLELKLMLSSINTHLKLKQRLKANCEFFISLNQFWEVFIRIAETNYTGNLRTKYVVESVAKPVRQFSHSMKIFSCLQTLKTTISKEMNDDNHLKFA